jgi:hypothetical protein
VDAVAAYLIEVTDRLVEDVDGLGGGTAQLLQRGEGRFQRCTRPRSLLDLPAERPERGRSPRRIFGRRLLQLPAQRWRASLPPRERTPPSSAWIWPLSTSLLPPRRPERPRWQRRPAPVLVWAGGRGQARRPRPRWRGHRGRRWSGGVQRGRAPGR